MPLNVSITNNDYILEIEDVFFHVYITGHKIAPNTGANATKFFTLATKS